LIGNLESKKGGGIEKYISNKKNKWKFFKSNSISKHENEKENMNITFNSILLLLLLLLIE